MTLISDTENLFSNAHSYDEYLWQVSLKSSVNNYGEIVPREAGVNQQQMAGLPENVLLLLPIVGKCTNNTREHSNSAHISLFLSVNLLHNIDIRLKSMSVRC